MKDSAVIIAVIVAFLFGLFVGYEVFSPTVKSSETKVETIKKSDEHITGTAVVVEKKQTAAVVNKKVGKNFPTQKKPESVPVVRDTNSTIDSRIDSSEVEKNFPSVPVFHIEPKTYLLTRSWNDGGWDSIFIDAQSGEYDWTHNDGDSSVVTTTNTIVEKDFVGEISKYGLALALLYILAKNW